MLNHVLNLIQYWFSISFCPKGEILKRVQDDKSVKFQVCLVSFRMRLFKVMGNRPSWKRDSFHGFGTPKLTDERFPPCLRPARRDYAQAGLKRRHPTACSVLKRK